MTSVQAYCFDLDGSLVDNTHFLHDWAVRKRTDYDEFHRLTRVCKPKMEILAELHKAWDAGYDIYLVTARGEKYRELTLSWLDEHGVTFHGLWMRPHENDEPDHVVKFEIIDDLTRRGVDFIHAFEDNPKMIALFEERGIPVTCVPGWRED